MRFIYCILRRKKKRRNILNAKMYIHNELNIKGTNAVTASCCLKPCDKTKETWVYLTRLE